MPRPLLILLASLLCCASAAAQTPSPLSVRVDPRVELVTIVARLAGFREFTMANATSPYSKAVDAHFGPHRTHAAVATLQALRRDHGVSYDALPSFAVHIEDVTTFEERVPFDAPPERLDERWGGARARAFLAELRDFAAVSKAADFFAGRAGYYAQVAERLSARLSQSAALPWFDSFFGAKAGARYTAIAGLLCGGGNFGVGIRFGDGRPEELLPVFGCWTWDEAGLPVFGADYLPLFVHEIAHSYTNPFVDRIADELAEPARALYATCAERMRRQSYGTPKTMLYESLVRATVVRCRLATEGRDAARAQAEEELAKHFAWVPELAVLLGEYEADRKTWPTFEAFLPKLSAFFVACSKQAVERQAKTPVLLSITPPDGATDVDPATAELVLRFDRPMRDKSWSFTGSKDDVPEIVGQPAYDAERKQLTVRVRLQPGRSYRVGINGPRSQGFASAEGVPLEPLEYDFVTRK